jgi:hypothetical protein
VKDGQRGLADLAGRAVAVDPTTLTSQQPVVNFQIPRRDARRSLARQSRCGRVAVPRRARYGVRAGRIGWRDLPRRAAGAVRSRRQRVRPTHPRHQPVLERVLLGRAGRVLPEDPRRLQSAAGWTVLGVRVRFVDADRRLLGHRRRALPARLSRAGLFARRRGSGRHVPRSAPSELRAVGRQRRQHDDPGLPSPRRPHALRPDHGAGQRHSACRRFWARLPHGGDP